MSTTRSRLCLISAVVLVAAKLAGVAVDPAGISPHAAPQVSVALVAVALLVAGRRQARGCAGRIGVAALLGVAWVMTAFIVGVAWADNELARDRGSRIPALPDDPHKVWATRGLVTDGEPPRVVFERNSIEAVRHAFAQGARGTEVDVRFDVVLGRFVVSHAGPPYDRPNGELLTLERLLDAVDDTRPFWLDWKKARHLTPDERRAAIARLVEVTRAGDRAARVWVETENPFVLAAVGDAGLGTILDVHPPDDPNPFSSVVVDLYKLVFVLGDFSVMSLRSGTREAPVLGPSTARVLHRVPLFVYHVPDEVGRLGEVAALANVRVVLVDQAVDRFGFVVDEGKRPGGDGGRR